MTDRHRVFVADKLSQDALAVLGECEALEVDYRPDLDVPQKIVAASEARALIIRSATKVTGDFLKPQERLELIVRAGVGVDNIDVEAATRKGILVQNVPEGNTRSAAEHTIALLMSLARNVPQATMSMRGGEWKRIGFLGVEVKGKTLGVIGLGKIGRHVIEMAFGLGFHVLAHDPFVSPSIAEQLGIELVLDLNELINRVDFLTVHVPLSSETKGLINEEALSHAQPHLRVINCARGGIVDEEALLKMLNDERIGGAALDVFEDEPPGKSELVLHPKVVVTPHLGASTREAQQNVAITAARQTIDYLVNRRLHSPVNAIQVDPDLTDDVEPFRQLAMKIGKLHAQLLQGNPSRVEVTYYGNLFTDRIQTYLTNSVLEGFVGRHYAQPVNFINVRTLAKDQGLIVEESSEGASRYFVNMLRVRVKDSEGERELGGAIRGRSGLRLVSLDAYQFDAVLEGELIIVANEDRPGMIGVLGQELASHNINVSYMTLGRNESGGTALAVLNIDSPVSGDVLEKLAASQGMLWAKSASVE